MRWPLLRKRRQDVRALVNQYQRLLSRKPLDYRIRDRLIAWFEADIDVLCGESASDAQAASVHNKRRRA